MRILIAPDKFKGSLGAVEVGERIAAGLRAALPGAEIEVTPIADGGEGTAAAILRSADGEWITCGASDALGRPLQARYVFLGQQRLAAIDMSAAAGMSLLLPDELNPLLASTSGVGQMLLHAAGLSVREVIVGLGGSATNDGGSGLARALGYRFLDRDGSDLPNEVPALLDLAQISSPNELSLPSVVAACDVENPLLGPGGATNVFGKQKGAGREDLELLERALTRLADVAAQTFGRDAREKPGAGAAGGLGFGLMTFCNATVRSGFEVVAEAIDLRSKIARADLVITGEGKLDRQTLAGKGPAGVARLARELRRPVYAIVGQASEEAEVRRLFEDVLTVDDSSPGYRDTAQLLEDRGRELALRLH